MATTTKLVELFNADETIAALSTQAFVEAAYENLLGLSGDFSNKDARVAYWVAKIDAGLATADFAATFLAAAAVQGDLLTDAEFAANTAALAAVAALDETGLTLEAVKAAAVASAEPEVEEPSNPGETFTLTTGAETVTGTAGDDTITGVVSSLSSTKTLDSTDVIDGGEGEDTLSLSMSTNFNGFTGDGSMTGVETVNLTNDSTLSKIFDATGATGITKVVLDTNDQDFTVQDLKAAGQTVEISNADAAKTVTIGYDSDFVTAAGTADAINYVFNDVGTIDDASTTSTDEQKILAVKSAGIETVTIASNGTDNVVNLNNTTDVNTSITVTGDANLKVTDVDSTLTGLDASAATGNIVADLSTATTIASISTGAGDDVLTIDGMNVEASIDAGAGADEVVLTDVAGTFQPAMAGVETLTLDTQTGDFTLAASGVTDLETVKVIGGIATTKTATVADLGTSALTVALTDKTGSATAMGANGAVVLASAQDLTVDVATVLGSSSGSDFHTDVTAGEATSLTATVGAYAVYGGDITAAKSSNVDLTIAKNGTFDGTITAATADAVKITANGSTTAGATVTAAKASSAEVTVGANGAIDNLDLAVDKATSVTIAASKSTAITVAAGDFSSVQSLTLSNLSDIDLSAVTVGDKSSAVSVDASGVKGAVDLDVDNLASGTGSVTYVGSSLGINTLSIGTGRNEVSVTGGIKDDAITLNSTFASTDEGVISVSLGSVSTADTLTLANADNDFSAATVTLSGVDQLIGGNAANDLVLNASVVSGQTMTIKTLADLSLNGSSSADTIDLSGITNQATGTTTITGGAGNDTITSTAASATVNAGAGSDTIALGAAGNADDLVMDQTSGKDTITNFVAGEDDLSITITGVTTAVNDVSTGGAVAQTAADADISVVEDAATGAASALQGGTETVTDFTDLTDVAAYLNEGFTLSASAKAAFVLNDGTDTYVYYAVNDTTAAIAASDLTLIGVFDGSVVLDTDVSTS